MITFLAIQNTYHTFQIALFEGDIIKDSHSEDKHNTSKLLVPSLEVLLRRNAIHFGQLSFVAVNQGPGPFSTLRSVIASVNGLYCATKMPLIGINGMLATLSEYRNPHYRSIVLLNAFNADIYYAIEQHNDTPLMGYEKIDVFLSTLQQKYPSETLFFIGNATQLYAETIKQALSHHAILPDTIPDMCSIKQIGVLGLEKWKHNDFISAPLLPLHLKKHPVELM